MVAIVFPSVEAPSYPNVSVDVPETWTPKVVPAAILAAVKEDASLNFAPNVIVTINRHPLQYQLSDAALAMDAELGVLPAAEFAASSTVTLGDLDAYCRTVSFVDSEAGTVAQTHVIVRVPNGLCADFVHAIGTGGGDRVGNDYPDILAIMASLRVWID